MGCACAGGRDKTDLADNCVEPALLLSQFSATESIRALSCSLSSLYRLKKVISRSDVGSLYRAEFRGTHQSCYLKVVPRLPERKQQQSILRLEAERLQRLDHPGLLRMLDVMQDIGGFYYVCEPFVGGQLSQCLGERWDEGKLARAMKQVFGALNYCHQQGVVHKRVSLESLVLTSQPQHADACIKLTNFGMLDSIPRSRSKIDLSHFSSPELGRNEKCDIWSCGVVMYALLAGQSPFSSCTVPLAQQKSRKKNLTFAPELWDDRSPEVISLIVSMLDLNPQARPSAAQCLAHPWIQLATPATLTPITISKCVRSLRLVHRRNPLKDGVLRFVLQRAIVDKRTRRFSAVFSALDDDGDGVLLEEELSRALRRCFDESAAQAAAKKVLRASQDPGWLSYTEFLVACYGEKRLLAASHLQAVFKCFEQGGTASMQDLYEYFGVRRAAEWASLKECVGSDTLDYAQFVRLLIANVT